MDRWTGVVKVSLNPSGAGPFFRVAASLLLSPSSKTLIAPSLNVIFFNGDQVQGTGNPVIERLSDSRYIAQLLASKLGSNANAWVLNASRFNGPFAIYKEFIPAVNYMGDPKRYDPKGFPASSNIVKILSHSIEQMIGHSASSSFFMIKSVLSTAASGHSSAPSVPPSATALPKTVILGFSKGGTVVNQIITELAHWKPSPQLVHEVRDHTCPVSSDGLLSSITGIHYVDVGLNVSGAYLTDNTVIGKAVENLLVNHNTIRFMLHGTPRQWCDKNRPWICEEKGHLLQLLKEEAHRCEGKLQVTERFYFANMAPSLQMHFEIIENIDIS